MVIDIIAFAAIFFAEPERKTFLNAITASSQNSFISCKRFRNRNCSRSRQGGERPDANSTLPRPRELSNCACRRPEADNLSRGGVNMGRGDTQRHLVSVTVFRTPSPRSLVNRCWPRDRISASQTSRCTSEVGSRFFTSDTSPAPAPQFPFLPALSETPSDRIRDSGRGSRSSDGRP